MTDSDSPLPPPQLTGKQRSWLRAQANALSPAVRAGKAGITNGVIAEVEQALLRHELIKVRLEKPDDKKGAAAELAERTRAVLCGLLGHTVILYRANPEKGKRGEEMIVIPGEQESQEPSAD